MFSWMGLLEASAAGGICILLFFLASQMMGDKYLTKYRKFVWILIALRMCVPISASLLPRPVMVEVPTLVLGERRAADDGKEVIDGFMEERSAVDGQAGAGVPASAKGGQRGDGYGAKGTADSRLITSQDVLMMLWACGCMGVLVYYLSVHAVFCHRMAQKSEECADEGILAMAADMAGELGMKRVPRIRLTRGTQTGPFTIGFFRSTVFLPDTGYQKRDLRYILRHELVHCAGRDTQLKLLFIAVKALHWFNPLAWFMKTMADQDMELACDERVLKDTTRAERNEYSEVLLSCVGTDRAGRSVLSTGYVQGIRFIKKRFRNIFNIQRKSGVAAVCVLVAVLMAVSGLVGFEAGRTVYAKNGIAIDRGIELRTDATGDGREDRIRVYDDTSMLTTTVGLLTADGRSADFRYSDDMWAASELVCGDLSGNGAADIAVMRYTNGMHGDGPFDVLYVEEEGGVPVWKQYPGIFIRNSAIDREQPEKFGDIACVGINVIERDGRHRLRLIAIDWDAFAETGDEDTMQCIDCSWQEGGWFIEDIQTIEGYYSEEKYKELLGPN